MQSLSRPIQADEVEAMKRTFKKGPVFPFLFIMFCFPALWPSSSDEKLLGFNFCEIVSLNLSEVTKI